jgi:hypothetical protein
MYPLRHLMIAILIQQYSETTGIYHTIRKLVLLALIVICTGRSRYQPLPAQSGCQNCSAGNQTESAAGAYVNSSAVACVQVHTGPVRRVIRSAGNLCLSHRV